MAVKIKDGRRTRAAVPARSGVGGTARGTGRVTLADIARACDVSPATVSLVLSGSPLVGSATRARVQTELARQGYVYNRSAANLRRRTSTAVALVINDLSNPFFAEFAAGVDETLGQAGYVTLLGNTGESLERQREVIGSLMEHGPAGVILSPAESSEGSALSELLGTHTPVIVFNREVPGGSWDYLVCDNRRGARLATEHLLGLGHRHIAFFGYYRGSSSCEERYAGYRDAMGASGLGAHDLAPVECRPGRIDAAAGVGRLLLRDPGVTAAVCYNDVVALGLMQGLMVRGVRVGRDFAVTGFDDIIEASVSAPSLTTVAVGPRLLGRRAAELVLERLQQPARTPLHSVAPVQLVVRATSCAPPDRPAA